MTINEENQVFEGQKFAIPALVYAGYESDSEEPMSKAVFSVWVNSLEDLQKKLIDSGIDGGDDAFPYILTKFKQDNFHQLNTELLEAYSTTGDIEYFQLFYRIYTVVRWCNQNDTAILEFFTSEILSKLLFNTQSQNHIELLKKEVTPTLEFDGKEISIEDYMHLAWKVSETNFHLVTSILFNDAAKRAIELGLSTQAEMFASKVKSYKGESEE